MRGKSHVDAVSVQTVQWRAHSRTGQWLTVGLAVLVFAPIVSLVGIVFFADALGLPQPEGRQTPQELWQALWVLVPSYGVPTLYLLALTGLLAFAIAYPCAWFVALYDFPLRRLIAVALILPLALPTYVVAMVYVDLFNYSGVVQELYRSLVSPARGYWFPQIRSVPGAAFVFALALYPYLYVLLFSYFRASATTLVHVARTLGARPRRQFLTFGISLTRPAAIAGLILVLLEVLNDFGTVTLLSVNTLTVGIMTTWFQVFDRSTAALLSLLLFAVVAAAVIVLRQQQQRRYEGRRYDLTTRTELKPVHAGLVICSLLLPVLLGFVLPLAQLGVLASGTQIPDTLLGAAWTSLKIGALAVTAILGIAVTLALQRRWGVLSRIPDRISQLGYALPGVTIAIGLLPVLIVLEQTINTVAQMLNLPSFQLSASIFAVTLAVVIRYLAVGINGVQTAFERLPLSLDESAQVLGTRRSRLFPRLYVPLMAKPLLLSGFLVVLDSLKELPATLVLRPAGTETIATLVFLYAGNEQFERAAIGALWLCAFGLVGVLALALETARRSDKPARP